jgi:hypothetical protein
MVVMADADGCHNEWPSQWMAAKNTRPEIRWRDTSNPDLFLSARRLRAFLFQKTVLFLVLPFQRVFNGNAFYNHTPKAPAINLRQEISKCVIVPTSKAPSGITESIPRIKHSPE